MIESREEFEAVMAAIKGNLKECSRLAELYNSIPTWAWLRQRKNLRRRSELLEANQPQWEKLQGGPSRAWMERDG